MKRSLFKKVRSLILVFVMLLTCVTAYGTELPASNSEKISVRVKATVPQDFSGNISVQYTGMNTEGFTASLTKENGYSILIPLEKDIYVYKQSSIADGYSLNLNNSFSLKSASKENIYSLNVEAVVGQPKQNLDTANIIFSADLGDTGYKGPIAINYSGTEGNTLLVTLNSENGYKMEVEAKRDVYTLKSFDINTGFTYDCLYSFSILEDNGGKNYELKVKVIKQQEVALEEYTALEQTETLAEPQTQSLNEIALSTQIPQQNVSQTETTYNTQAKNIEFKAIIPTIAKDFTGSIYVSYVDEMGTSYNVELNSVNQYIETLQLPYGTYQLEYAVSYDATEYQFNTQSAIIVNENTPDNTNTLVHFVKDGNILVEEAATTTGQSPSQENTKATSSAGAFGTVIGILVLVIVGLVVLILNKKKSSPKKASKDYEEDDEEEDEE